MNDVASLPPLGAFAACGIELEYMIVDRDTLGVLPIADRLLQRAAGAATPVDEVARGRFAWSNELVLHLVEVKNARPDADVAQLAAGFQAEVGAIDRLLADFDARLMPTATHPWMDPAHELHLWPHQHADIYMSYHHIFDCRQHGWANLQSVHVNLPFADDAEFVRLHAALRLLLPLLPALAASSPVADGERKPVLDFRMACYCQHPRRVPALIGQVVPDDTAGRADYEARVLAPMYHDIAPFDPDGVLRHEWLNTRGVMPRFDRNALEVRVIDVQECPQADLAIAAITVAAARALYEERWSPLAAQRAMDTGALFHLLQGTIHDADRHVIDDAAYLGLFGMAAGPCEAGALWRHLLDACGDDPALSPIAADTLQFILDRGPLARRIVAALGGRIDRVRLQAMYRRLCDCLAAGELFAGAAS